jgi:2-dehydro-3-deoxyphosphogluconate aldolase/(4S)-4-hydroxy-2-oxoglutarate aldolase
MMINRFRAKKVIPVATIEHVDDAAALTEALLSAGMDIIEVTFRTDAAAGAIRAIRASYREMLVGAGTVLDGAQLKRAADAGAHFAVSPGLAEQLVVAAADAGIPYFPGVATPTEIMRGMQHGCTVLKFFPAEAAGGVTALKAIAGPFSHTGVSFIPTGGITASNARAYLDLPFVVAVGGSWIVDRKLIKKGAWEDITRITKEALAI